MEDMLTQNTLALCFTISMVLKVKETVTQTKRCLDEAWQLRASWILTWTHLC